MFCCGLNLSVDRRCDQPMALISFFFAEYLNRLNSQFCEKFLVKQLYFYIKNHLIFH